MTDVPLGWAGARPAAPDAVIEALARESAALVSRLRLWTPGRFAAGAGDGRTRGDVVHHLAQALVEAAGVAPVALPRLDDLVLPDQLAVAADDLVKRGPPQQIAADALTHLLAHRAGLLAEAIPPALATMLGDADGPALLQRARGLCGHLDPIP